ncbi:DNA-binding protein [Haloarchaeobius amylolyticus]|uniref:DNA-binding protein n=1 Tax=Haloarchaeobius amylolyticus TaxID=1198296 RepID=UPI002271308F|nr:DNA-binding protein [Haloarchaeobius amylolyticus]
MPEDASAILNALDRAEDAFGGYTTGEPDYEAHLDPEANQPSVIQLRKACRLLDACRTLREHDGYHTSVIEMSFAAIERTLEFYALSASNDSVNDFQNHTRAYNRAAALGVFSEQTARRLQTLYTDNRSAAYYRDTVATAEQADMMFSLAETIHEHVKNFSQQSYECCCNG